MSDPYEALLAQLQAALSAAGGGPPGGRPSHGSPAGAKPVKIEHVKGNGAFIETSDGSMWYADLVRHGRSVTIALMKDGKLQDVADEHSIHDQDVVYSIYMPEAAITLAPYIDEVDFNAQPPSIKDLYVDVRDALMANIDFVRDVYYKIVAAWIVATHFVAVFDAFPQLGIFGLAGSGKTTLLDLVARLGRRPVRISDVTQAAFFRMVDALRPSMLIDEVEAAPSEVRLMMRLAYKKGNFIPRVEFIQGIRSIVLFDTYAPVAYASTMYPDDEALISRSVIVRMVRRPKVARIAAQARKLEAIRRDLVAASFMRYHEVRRAYDRALNELANRGVGHRDAEIYAPIVAILLLAGEKIDDVVQHIKMEREEKDAASDIDLAIAEAVAASPPRPAGDFVEFDWLPLIQRIIHRYPWLAERLDDVVRRMLAVGARVVSAGKIVLRMHVEQYKMLVRLMGLGQGVSSSQPRDTPDRNDTAAGDTDAIPDSSTGAGAQGAGEGEDSEGGG